MPGLPRRDRQPPVRKGRDPAEPGGPVRDAGRLRGGTRHAQHREIPARHPRPHDDRRRLPSPPPSSRCSPAIRRPPRGIFASNTTPSTRWASGATWPPPRRSWPEPSRRKGQSRYDEATRLIAISQEAAADEDLSTQAVGQGLSARILADRGHYREAEELARSAAALAAQTDLLSEHADTLLDLVSRPRRGRPRSPKHTPQPPRPSTSTSARATCQEPGNRSDTLPNPHPPERMSLMPPQPHPWVTDVTITDGQIVLTVEVDRVQDWGAIELSGYATQDGGAFAAFQRPPDRPRDPTPGNKITHVFVKCTSHRRTSRKARPSRSSCARQGCGSPCWTRN